MKKINPGRCALTLVLFVLASSAVQAQQRFLLEGLFDIEVYDTNSQSFLLSRNEGDLSFEGRLRLWSAYQLSDGLQIYALGEFETENASGHFENEAELEQLALRYTTLTAPYIVVEGGKILSPNSVFNNYQLSSKNPLIGMPLTHPITYPLGVQISGSFGGFDYRAALTDLPDYQEEFFNFEPDTAFRPVLGAGYSPVAGLRIGASYTQGPYLADETNLFLPQGDSWRDYEQEVSGLDFMFSKGYLEISAEWARADYEIPFRGSELKETRYFIEARYAWSPRLFGAIRFQSLDGALVSSAAEGAWFAENRKLHDVEFGFGYRFNANTLLKVTYRYDHWKDKAEQDANFSDGHSLGMQLSIQLYPQNWFGQR